MPIYLRGVRCSLTQTPEEIITREIKTLGLPQGEIRSCHISKLSLDARRRGDIHFVLSAKITLGSDARERAVAAQFRLAYKPETLPVFTPGSAVMQHRPVIAGFGPAGIFCALVLARQGYKPIVLERGGTVDERVSAIDSFHKTRTLDTRSNIQFGEGGAGTFSDGKLVTRIGDERVNYVLDTLAHFGAPEEIRYLAKPHIGTDLLRRVVVAMREEIIRLGGEVRFHSKLEDVTVQNGKLVGLKAEGADIPADCLVLAVGHSARDTFETLLQKRQLQIAPKPFSVGVRIEALQSDIDRGLYGDLSGHPRLPVGEYQHSLRTGAGNVYTFCMCPGGEVVAAASEEGGVVTNGMSYHARAGLNANSALVVGVDTKDFGDSPQAAIAYQRDLERRAFALGGSDYRAPAQTVGRFLKGEPGADFGRVTPTYPLGVKEANLNDLFNPRIIDMLSRGLRVFNKRLPGFANGDGVLAGVETRTSSPIRILRGDDLCAGGGAGIYPCGEGAGYAGGIVSAAVDGIRVASAIIEKYKPKE